MKKLLLLCLATTACIIASGKSNPPSNILRITYPTKSDTLRLNESCTIRWSGKTPTPEGAYAVYLSGGPLGPQGSVFIGTARTSQTSINWDIPKTVGIQPGQGYQLQISNGAKTLTASDTFTIAPGPAIGAMSALGSIKLTYPNGGESVTSGTKITITWQVDPKIDHVTIGCTFDDGGNTWLKNASYIPNTGSYVWFVNVGKHYLPAKVKIYIMGNHGIDGTVTDISDEFFTVGYSGY